MPRTRLVEILERIYEIGDEFDLVIMNVFHAGDGNLHPLIAFDRRDAEQVERVHAAGTAIIEACVAVGGVLSGEHGIGLEKRDFMPLTFSAVDLDAQARAREAFDPEGLMNPDKVLPIGSRCGELVLDAGLAAARHLAVSVASPGHAAGVRGGPGRGERRRGGRGRRGRRHALARRAARARRGPPPARPPACAGWSPTSPPT